MKSFLRIISLSPPEVKRGYYYYFFLFLSSFLELLGIGLVIPLISLWLDDQYLSQIILKYNLSFRNFIFNKDLLLSLLIIAFIFVFVSKNLLLTLLLNYRNNLSAKIHEFFQLKF